MNTDECLHRPSWTQSVATRLLSVLAAAIFLSYSTPAFAAEPTKNILLLFSEDAYTPSSAIVNQGIRRTFSRESPNRIQFYSEYLDRQRLPDERYRTQLVNFLRLKYAGQKLDLVVAVSKAAIELSVKEGAKFAPNTQIVYVALDSRELDGIDLPPHVTGVAGRITTRSTVDLVLHLQPKTRQVVLVFGTTEWDRYWERNFREELRDYRRDVTFTYLSGLKMEDLEKEVARLPGDSVVVFTSLNRDGKGTIYLAPEALSMLARVSSVPIYGPMSTYLDNGIVGGVFSDLDALGARGAKLGLSLLAGAKAVDIKAESLPNVPTLDWRQLQRWGISEDSLPPGSIVRFRQLSVWEQYKGRILLTIALILIQAILIAALLINRAMRKRAQQTLAERLRSEALLADVSAALVNLPVQKFDYEIEKWLARIVESLDVDRVSLVEYSPSGTMLGVAHSHSRDGGELGSDLVLLAQSPWYAQQFERGKPLAFSRLPDELPEEARQEKEYCLKTGLKSNVIIPLAVGGATNGALALSSSRSYRQWPDEVVGRLQLLGEVFANALSRKHGDQSLQNAFSEIKGLKDQLQAENTYLQEEIKLNHNFDEIVGNSDELKYVLYKVEQVAVADTTVLVMGETGTGKELIARAIHQASQRKDRTLVKVNCAALPAALIESELFGHEKGAFTSAAARQLGRFELANNGTLFLDEIGELPLELQPKLLRVLQDGEFERLGGAKTIKVDVRVIAATNRNLRAEVQAGRFREDLFYRLSVFPVTMPPLRRRKGDLPLLVNHYVNRFAKKLGKPIHSIAPGTVKLLEAHSWPGNIRELANVIERAVINGPGPVLHLADQLESAPLPKPPANGVKSLAEVERETIYQRLVDTDWKIEGPKGAAKSLAINPSTLRLRMTKLGIQRPDPPS